MRRTRIVVVVCALWLLPGCGDPVDPGAPDRPRAAVEGPSFRCDDPIYDLGRVWVGEPFEIQFNIENAGTEDLKILGIKSTCGCVATGDYDRVIRPGQKSVLPFLITTRNLGFKKLDKKVMVYTNDPRRRTVELGLEGMILDRIEVEPRVGASFGRVKGGEPVQRELRILNHLDETIDLTLRPGVGTEKFRPRLETVEEGREYRLLVEFDPPERGGMFRENILLDTGILSPPVVTVHASALVPRRLDVLPLTVVAPEPTDREARRTVRVLSYRSEPIRVISATTPDPRVRIEVRQPPGSDEALVDLVFPAGYAPDDSGFLLTIETDDEVVPTLTVPVRPRPRIGRRSGREEEGSQGS